MRCDLGMAAAPDEHACLRKFWIPSQLTEVAEQLMLACGQLEVIISVNDPGDAGRGSDTCEV